MTEDFALLSLRFLLNEMSPAERELFDKRLLEHPGDCALFKSYADALAAHAEKQAADMGELSLEQALRLLDGLQLETSPEPLAGKFKPAPWKRYFWPAAAAVLLAFNLWQFGRSIQHSTTTATDGKDSSRLSQANAAGTPRGANDTGTATGVMGAGKQEAELAALIQRHEQLQAECEALQGIKTGLEKESHRIVMRLRTLSVSDGTGNSLAAMELVTPAKYASGERKGLLDAARKILNSAGGVVSDNGAAATGPNTTVNNSGTIPTAGRETSYSDQSQPAASDSLIVLGAVMQSTAAAAGTASTAEPYAWTVLDGSSSEGCINFYNLPTVNSGEALVLWTKSADSDATFVRVGSLPAALIGKSGNVFFRAADGSLPVEILVTKESKSQVPLAPSSKVVLRGP